MSGRGCGLWENREAILRDLESRGVAFRLHPETGEFRYRDAQHVLSVEEETGIDVCRVGLTEALRKRLWLCIACGMDTACKPSRTGGRWPFYHPDCPGVHWVEVSTLLVTPLWCDFCYVTEHKRGLPQKEGINARRETPDLPDEERDESESTALF